MNIAQVNQSVNVVSSKGKPVQVKGKSFSEEFKKYYTAPAEKQKPVISEDSKAEGLENELSDSEEETDQEAASFSLINPFLKLDAEVTDLKQTLEGESLASLTNGTNSMSDSISQKLKTDTTVNDLSEDEQTFILHNEPADNEGNLFAANQPNMSELQVKQGSKESSTATRSSTEMSSQDQTEILTALSDFTQTLDANSRSALVKEISEMMESTELNEAAKASELELSPAVKEALKNGELEKVDPEILQKIVSSLNKALNTKKKTSQNITNELKSEPENETFTQVTGKETDSLKQLSTEKGEAQKAVNHSPVAPTDKQKPTQTVEMTQSRELQTTDVDTEVTGKLPSANSVKTEGTQADIDYDFVSMLRQMSTQSSKESSQIVAKSNTEASVPVPKEQSVNLVQDMVARFAENKEGLKTYKTTLHLSPETLGKVTIELSLNEEGLSGKLTFQSDETRKWMEGEWLDLKLPLESKGLTIKAFDFTTSQPATQQQSGSSFSEQPSQSEQDSQRRSLSEDHDLTLAENDEQMPETRSTNKDGINVYV